jgi:hypothetical protein
MAKPEEETIPLPLCPHCNADLPGVGLFNWQHGIWVIFCVYCPECRRTIHMQVAPVGLPAEAVPSPLVQPS